MASETKIVSDLKKINAVQDKEGIQLSAGAAYFGSSIILHHGNKGQDYQYPPIPFTGIQGFVRARTNAGSRG